MKALFFLFIRSFFNGIKRAVTHVRRLIALIFFFGYYIFILLRPGDSVASGRLVKGAVFDMPSTVVLESFVFAGLGLASLLMLAGLFSYRGNFRPADVDVLFPTPVSPKVVLVFRLVRDYFATLLLPLVIAIIGLRASTRGLEFFIRSFPSGGAYALRATTIAYLGMMLAWVSLGYAGSLYINRSDLKSDRNRTLMMGGLTLSIAGVLLVIGETFSGGASWSAFVEATHHPWVRIAMLPAWTATSVVMGPLRNSWLEFCLGLAGLVAIILAGFWLALRQVHLMYDQASARGFDTVSIQSLRQQGDAYALAAMKAKTRKVGNTWLSRRLRTWYPTGAKALLWKEILLQTRGAGLSAFLPGLIYVVAAGAMILFIKKGTPLNFPGYVLLYCNGLMAFTLGLSAGQSGFIELLRRVDFQKPLPFSPARTVFWEVTAKAILPTLWGIVLSVFVVGLEPAAWAFGIASSFLVAAFTLTLVATVFLVVVLFPDIEDATQRGFRGIMILVGSAITCAPGLSIFITMLAFKFSPIVAMVLPCVVCLAISIGVCAIGGRIYATFNPSE